MNYLAHIYLSGQEEEVKIGGFIADSIKGSKYNEYPEGMRFGILLHRKIDTYTDMHPAVMRSIQRFRHVYGKYSGVAVDMLYDHYLASDWGIYSDLSLKDFSRNFYASLNRYKAFLPERFLQFMPIFIRKDRLSSYADLTVFEELLQKMGEHTAMPEASEAAIDLIWSEYYNFKDDFLSFFPDLTEYTKKLYPFRNAEPKEVLAYKPS